MIAKCKEKSKLSALANGHGAIWPQAEVRIIDGWAYFYKDGKQVWECNETYAIKNFNLSQLTKGKA